MVFKGVVSITIVFPVIPQVPKKLSIMKTVVTLPSSHAAAGLEGRNNRRAGMEKKQVSNGTFKCIRRVFAFLMWFFLACNPLRGYYLIDMENSNMRRSI